MMKTIKPRRTTSRTMIYIMHKMPNVSHQRWGDEWRHVFMDVYSRICAVRNHVKVISEERSDKLSRTI